MPSPKLWTHAAKLAAQTPATRNRCVDFLRAISILIVVLAHWLMAAPYIEGGEARITHLLKVAPWSQWFTWFLQVMPIFFFVGGYSNGITWKAALRDNKPYKQWLAGRLRRLLHPVMVLLLFWVIVAAIAHRAGVPAAFIRVGSQIALVPTWFLAVYTLVVLAVPLSYSAWRSFGMGSVLIPAALAAAMDLFYFEFDLKFLGWLNYPFVWFSIHQLGYAWLEGRFSSRTKAALWCIGGLALLVLLTEAGPWPRSLVGVPGEKFSNTTPPHIPLLALGAFQFGAVTLLEQTIALVLAGASAWTATVLINGMIMTVFLWHSTVMMLLFGLSLLFGGVGLHSTPTSGEWWIERIGWIAVFSIGLIPFVVIFGKLERTAQSADPPAWRLILGSLMVVAGLAFLALDGIGAAGWLGLKVVPLLLAFAGAELAGFGFNRTAVKS